MRGLRAARVRGVVYKHSDKKRLKEYRADRLGVNQVIKSIKTSAGWEIY